jgi:8-oxo-dGTP diphosphatase
MLLRVCDRIRLVANVVRDITEEFDGRQLRMVTRLDDGWPPLDHISTAHCLAFEGEQVVLAFHRHRDWTIPGGHLEPGESPEDAMAREAAEEAGAVVIDPILFAHEQIDPVDGTASDPRYPVPSFQLFFVARLVDLGAPSATEECTESKLFTPDEARQAPGWMQRNRSLYEAALDLTRRVHVPDRR